MAKRVTKATQSGVPNVIINQITVHQMQQHKILIDKWRKIQQAAMSVLSPIRKQLYEYYAEFLLDAHVYTIYSKRIRNVRRINFKYVEEGKDTTEINKALPKNVMRETINKAMEAVSWGSSVCEYYIDNGKVHMNLIPRMNVRPELGIICFDSYTATDGIPYREAPYNKYVAEFDCGLGLLNIAAMNVILKRQGTIDYANFIEIFGQPIRQYEYDPLIQGAKEEVEKVAANTGNSAAMVMPKDYATVTLHNGVNSSSEKLHPAFLKELRDELTTLFLGQTMTTGDGSSQSQATVHQDEQSVITQDDAEWVADQINEIVKPILINLGFPLEKGVFEPDYGDTRPLKEQLEMDLKLDDRIDIEPEYFYEKYKVPVPKTGPKRKNQTQEQTKEVTQPPKEQAGQKKKLATKTACCEEHSPYTKYFS